MNTFRIRWLDVNPLLESLSLGIRRAPLRCLANGIRSEVLFSLHPSIPFA